MDLPSNYITRILFQPSLRVHYVLLKKMLTEEINYEYVLLYRKAMNN